MSTNPSLKSSANAADDPSKRTARTKNRDTRDIFISFTGRLLNTFGLEKVADGEFEDDGLLAGRVQNGMPHSKRSGPIGENQRKPNPQLAR